MLNIYICQVLIYCETFSVTAAKKIRPFDSYELKIKFKKSVKFIFEVGKFVAKL